MEEALYNRLGGDRISSRQVDELIGIARGIAADGVLNHAEVEFLQKWLAANLSISDQPVIRTLFERVSDILRDGIADAEECTELLDTLNRFSNRDFELGEVLKSTSLPLCNPPPDLDFTGRTYCFTGTFTYGKRGDCERAVTERGASCGGLSLRTNYLIVGVYATESWKHSSMGNKILKACEWRDEGVPISIVSEEHWTKHL